MHSVHARNSRLRGDELPTVLQRLRGAGGGINVTAELRSALEAARSIVKEMPDAALQRALTHAEVRLRTMERPRMPSARHGEGFGPPPPPKRPATASAQAPSKPSLGGKPTLSLGSPSKKPAAPALPAGAPSVYVVPPPGAQPGFGFGPMGFGQPRPVVLGSLGAAGQPAASSAALPYVPPRAVPVPAGVVAAFNPAVPPAAAPPAPAVPAAAPPAVPPTAAPPAAPAHGTRHVEELD
jgi:hypothetical protein